MTSRNNKVYGSVFVILFFILISSIVVFKKDKILGVNSSKESVINADIINKDEKSSENNKEHSKKEDLDKLLSIKNNPLMILVNRENSLSNDYVPSDLILSDIEFVEYIETRYLSDETAEATKRMFYAAKEDGITLLGASGYRSYQVQENLYNSRVDNEGQEEADKYTAKPGQSEHQTGLAIDILSEDYPMMDDDFDTTEAYKWLNENCYKYGFILRYPKGKESITGFFYEPWHYRYIGDEEVAKYIMDKGLTFEEYIEEIDNKIAEYR